MNTVVETIESDERGLLLTCPHCAKRNRMNYERLGHTFRCGQCHQELPAPGEPIEISNEPAFDALISRSPLTVLMDFWAPWCGPCKMVAPELARIAREGAGRWVVAKVNPEELPGLAQRFGIRAIPTMVLFKGGREVTRQSGAMPAAGIRHLIQRVG
jgi:thioredoxin 2